MPTRPGGDDLPFVYYGTLLTQGQGLGRVVATGVHTEIGKIGKALQTLVPELSIIQRDTRRAVVIFAMIGLALASEISSTFSDRNLSQSSAPASVGAATRGQAAWPIAGCRDGSMAGRLHRAVARLGAAAMAVHY